MNDILIITDNICDAQLHYPGHEIMGDLGKVVLLPIGTRVKIHEVKTGTTVDGPCHAARVMVKNGMLEEVEAQEARSVNGATGIEKQDA